MDVGQHIDRLRREHDRSLSESEDRWISESSAAVETVDNDGKQRKPSLTAVHKKTDRENEEQQLI